MSGLMGLSKAVYISELLTVRSNLIYNYVNALWGIGKSTLRTDLNLCRSHSPYPPIPNTILCECPV